MNKVILVGNTTRAVELNHLPSGSAVAKTGLAVNRNWKDKMTGEAKQEVMFIDLVCYGKSAETLNIYVSKGSKLLIEGRLVFEQWEDQAGQKRSRHIVSIESFEFLDKKESEQNSSHSKEMNYDTGKTTTYATPNVDEEIPF